MAEVFVDTNVFVYAFDATEADKQARAIRVLDDLGHRATLSTQVMVEFHHTVTRRLPMALTASQALDVLRDLATLNVVATDARLVIEAAELAESSQLSIWDAAIVAAAARAGCTSVLTEDLNAGQVIAGVEVIDPFA